MRKLSKKISMLMVLAMLVSLFSGIVSASAASVWSFKSSKYDVEVGETIEMEKNEYADFDLFKSDAAPAGYTVKWKSSDPDAVWVNAKTGQLRADKFKTADYGDKATISATFTNTATKKSATRSFVIVVAEKAAYTLTTKIGDVVLGAEALAVDTEYALASTVTANGKAVEATVAYTVDGAVVKSLKFAAAGEYTVVATATVDGKVVATAKTAVVVAAKAFSAVATGVKEITVNGNFAQDAKITVKKGSANINVAATKIAADGKSAVITLTNKLSKGTYVVACGNDSAEVVAEDEKVASIVILDDGAIVTVSNDRTDAYVHYDVLNQYGESVRKNYSVSWTASTGASVVDEKAKGLLTIPAAVDPTKTYTYGTTIIITGVHTSTGNVATVNASVIAGLENRVSTVEILGVVKENTPTITTLPAGFTDGDYLLVYKAFDQAGYELDYSDAEVANNLTFTSLSPLLINSIFVTVPGGVVIDGEIYGAVRLYRGIQANMGGIAKIQVTSTLTGATRVHEISMVEEQTLASFTLLEPDMIIAEGDGKIEIPYEAYDQNGNPVKDFRVLYGSVSLSDTALFFEKQNDGSAKVFYNVPANVGASKNVDVPRVYTSTVINTGSVSTITLNIKDFAVPTSIKGLGAWIATKVAEYGTTSVKAVVNNDNDHSALVYYDQYDREMSNTRAFSRFGGLSAAVKVTSDAFTTSDVTGTIDVYEMFEEITFSVGADVTAAQLAQTFEFVLVDTLENEVMSGSAKKEVFTAVDITQCRSFFVEGDAKLENNADVASYTVKGTLADGTNIVIPGNYLELSASKSEAGAADMSVAPAYGADAFLDKSGYKADGSYLECTQSFDVIVKVSTVTGASVGLRDTVTLGVVVNDDDEKVVTLNPHSWLNGAFTVQANAGVLTYKDLITNAIDSYVTNYDDKTTLDWWKTEDIKITISKIEENSNSGLHSGSLVNPSDLGALTLVQNAVSWATQAGDNEIIIANAEIGDTFVVTYEKGDAKLALNCTVGADKTATFTSATDIRAWR